MRNTSEIVIPEVEVHLAFNEDYQRTLNNEYLFKHIAQEQGVRVNQVYLHQPIFVERSTNTVTFNWSVMPEPTAG